RVSKVETIQPPAPGTDEVPDVTPTKLNPTKLQTALDSYKESLIGMEYVIELLRPDDEPHYICLLCDKKCDPRMILGHAVSFMHRLKYITLHFPTFNSSLQARMKEKFPAQKVRKKKTENIITRTISIIEKKFGRLNPLYAEQEESFFNKRDFYVNKIKENKHLK
ncbi:hypothetical protein L9F63_020744, partial [Diploptera punctata]